MHRASTVAKSRSRRSEGFLFATTWQPAVFVNFLKGSNAVLKILERFLDAGLPT